MFVSKIRAGVYLLGASLLIAAAGGVAVADGFGEGISGKPPKAETIPPRPYKPIGGSGFERRGIEREREAWRRLEESRRRQQEEVRRRLQEAERRAQQRQLQQQRENREKLRERLRNFGTSGPKSRR